MGESEIQSLSIVRIEFKPVPPHPGPNRLSHTCVKMENESNVMGVDENIQKRKGP